MTAEPLQAVQADATADPAGVEVTLATDDGDVTVTVPPVGRWYTEATEALEASKFNQWAELTLSAEDFAQWRSVRKRNDDVVEFFLSWQRASGEDPKGSRPSGRSSRTTAKR